MACSGDLGVKWCTFFMCPGVVQIWLDASWHPRVVPKGNDPMSFGIQRSGPKWWCGGGNSVALVTHECQHNIFYELLLRFWLLRPYVFRVLDVIVVHWFLLVHPREGEHGALF